MNDRVKVSYRNNTVQPTGTVDFMWWDEVAHCNGLPTSEERGVTLVNATGGVTSANSSYTGELSPGDYSYRAFYHPDAAAKAVLDALGVKIGPYGLAGECEQLRILAVTAD